MTNELKEYAELANELQDGLFIDDLHTEHLVKDGQIYPKMYIPKQPLTEAEKIVAALNALNRSFPEPAHTVYAASYLLPALPVGR